MTEAPDQLLFSYGALRGAETQLSVFGRLLETQPDILPGYTSDYAEIEDPRFMDLIGTTIHPVLRATGNPIDKVFGHVLLLTEDELDAADLFEMLMFRRASVVLATGRSAWVYLASS